MPFDSSDSCKAQCGDDSVCFRECMDATKFLLRVSGRLVERLREIERTMGGDPEIAHPAADKALLEFIDNADVTEAYEDILKWYS